VTERPAYPSDLSDARWALIAPRLTAWRQARTDAGVGGRTASHDLREIFNAILYVNRTGITVSPGATCLMTCRRGRP
jgi:transposase